MLPTARGVAWNDSKGILGIVQAIASSTQLSLGGLLTHAGQAYHARSKRQVMDIHQDTIQRMNQAREKLARVQPRDIAQAGRVSGITPADLAVLTVAVEAARRKRKERTNIVPSPPSEGEGG